ncbi:MAG: HAMP domain-containing histidine kinase [Acidimicrobiales bacterium]|nr:HAMP domain-containing histidine kinase [Acidimicrobiales bacterium]
MSLRARLVLGMALVALALVGGAIALTSVTERDLVRQVDAQLDRSVNQLRPERRPPPDRVDEGLPSTFYAARLDESTGTFEVVLIPSTTTTVDALPDLDAESVADHVATGPFTIGSQGSDLRYRAVVQRDQQRDQVVVLALPLEDVDASVARLVRIQVLVSVAVLAMMGLVTFWVLRLGVRPIRQMTEAATAMGEGDLSQRVPDAPAGTEAGDLGDALNQMLGRIEESWDERTRSEERLRQFVADASHELRTPVTTIGGYAELYRLGGLSDPGELDEAMRRTEQESTRMGQLVGDLLALARLDQGRPVELATVDAAAVARDAAADAGAVEPDRPITVEAPPHAPVLADEGLLRQVVANLVGNVRVHTDPEATLTLRVTPGPGATVVEVIDDGPGMAPEVAARAFERFFRADPARTRHRGGSGLGLSIVRSSVEAMGGTAELRSRPGAGTTVAITLPHPA